MTPTSHQLFEIQMLREVEGGCFGQIRAFAKEWPEDLSLAKRAFSAILAHLDADEIIQLHEYHLINAPDPKDAPEKSIVITSCMTTIEEVFLRLETASPDYAKQLLDGFWPHLPGFLATLDYYAHHAPWLMSTTNPWIKKIQSGNAIRVSMLRRLLNVGLDSLKAQPDFDHMVRRIVDEVFKSWFWGLRGEQADPDAEAAIPTPEGYNEGHHPLLLRLMWKCMIEEEIMEVIQEKIAACNGKLRKRMIQSFVHRCNEWIDVHKQEIADGEDTEPTIDCGHLISLVLTCQDLGSEAEFSHTLARTNFSSFVLSCAQQFKYTPTTRSCGGTVATELAALVFLPRRPYAYELQRIVPEVLDAGLLTYIIDDLLSAHQTQANLFPSWWDRNPLQDLYAVSHHPATSRAIYRAIADLPRSTKEAIEANPLARKHWGTFTRNIQLYQFACERWVDTDCGRMCDNPQHHAGGYRPVEKSFACGRCQTVLYCSRECQRQDWNNLHKNECEDARVQRIESQLQGGWLSPRSRMAYFYFLEQGLLQQVLPSKMSQREDSDRFSEESGDSDDDEDVVYWTDTLDAPMKFEPVPMGDYCEKNISGLQYYVDARGRALLRKSEERSTYLVSSVSVYGDHVITVLAVFKVAHQPLEPNGSGLPPKVLLLHGMVKVKK